MPPLSKEQEQVLQLKKGQEVLQLKKGHEVLQLEKGQQVLQPPARSASAQKRTRGAVGLADITFQNCVWQGCRQKTWGIECCVSACF